MNKEENKGIKEIIKNPLISTKEILQKTKIKTSSTNQEKGTCKKAN